MKKMMLLALAVASAAMFALPAVASAGEPEVHCPSGAVACGAFTTHGGQSVLSQANGLTVTCTTNTGSGSFSSKKAGTFQLTFHGCRESIFNTTCQSSGQPAGTIKTNVMSFKNVYLTHGKTTPGVQVSGVNTTFVCAGGFSHNVVTGSVLGTLTSPKCGGSGTLTLDFVAASHGNQAHDFVTGTGAAVGLTNNGSPSAMDATGTVTVPGKTPTVTCV